MSDAPDSLSSDKAKEEEINAAFAGKNPKKFNPNDPSDAANYNGPTDSHILSQTKPQDNEAKGLAHRAGENEPGQVSDIGWGSSDTVQERVVPGLSNEDLFMLIRRFNKVCPYSLPGNEP